MYTIKLEQWGETKGQIKISTLDDWNVAAENFGNSLYNDDKLEQGYYDVLLLDKNHILFDHIILVA